MKKLILVVLSIFILSGCTNEQKSKLEESYENMQTDNTIESYQLDLRIYGSYNNETINETIKIDNYKNTQFKIDNIGNNSKLEHINEELIMNEDTALYVVDGKKYRFKDGNYVEVEEENLYTNPDVYLQSLKEIRESKSLRNEKIGDITYKTYEITISKDDAEDILNDSVLKDVKLVDDITCKVWINDKNQVYKIIYYLTDSIESKEKLEISASYFRINLIEEIKNMIGIK